MTLTLRGCKMSAFWAQCHPIPHKLRCGSGAFLLPCLSKLS